MRGATERGGTGSLVRRLAQRHLSKTRRRRGSNQKPSDSKNCTSALFPQTTGTPSRALLGLNPMCYWDSTPCFTGTQPHVLLGLNSMFYWDSTHVLLGLNPCVTGTQPLILLGLNPCVTGTQPMCYWDSTA